MASLDRSHAPVGGPRDQLEAWQGQAGAVLDHGQVAERTARSHAAVGLGAARVRADMDDYTAKVDIDVGVLLLQRSGTSSSLCAFANSGALRRTARCRQSKSESRSMRAELCAERDDRACVEATVDGSSSGSRTAEHSER